MPARIPLAAHLHGAAFHVTADDLFVDREAFLARVRGYIRIAESRIGAH